MIFSKNSSSENSWQMISFWMFNIVEAFTVYWVTVERKLLFIFNYTSAFHGQYFNIVQFIQTTTLSSRKYNSANIVCIILRYTHKYWTIHNVWLFVKNDELHVNIGPIYRTLKCRELESKKKAIKNTQNRNNLFKLIISN